VVLSLNASRAASLLDTTVNAADLLIMVPKKLCREVPKNMAKLPSRVLNIFIISTFFYAKERLHSLKTNSSLLEGVMPNSTLADFFQRMFESLSTITIINTVKVINIIIIASA
jgi:hypothetical protein